MCVHSEAETRLSFICKSTPQSMTSLRLPTTDVIELHQGFRATRLPVRCKGQKVRSSSVKNVCCWLFILGEKRLLVNRDRFSVKRLIFFKCDELSKSTAFTFNTLLIFLEYLFEFLINTASPASDSVYQQNFTAKKL